VLLVMHWRGVRMPATPRPGSAPVSGLPQQRDPWTMVAWGERTLDAGLATILNSTSPIFTFFLTLAIVRHEALHLAKIIRRDRRHGGICLIVGVEALSGFGDS